MARAVVGLEFGPDLRLQQSWRLLGIESGLELGLRV